MSQKNAIEPSRQENYPEWYQQVVKAADLAENSPVRGCMVIKPLGYAIWENIQRVLDRKFKETGHQNAYFPLFIPLSYLQKEAQHVDGFAKECAVVTHHRLEKDKEGKLVPAGELEEPLIVRPTSEMVIGEAFSRWVQSYRDLPILINQWANVVRWEMRTRLFLRTAEFLWQEGHTAHATEKEAREETHKMLGVYADFARDYLAIPMIKGRKTESEKFPGAEETYTIEAMMQDRKALQAGTSHFLGQNFAKASQIKFCDEEGKEVYAWTTSWGLTTRLIGALVMTHSDDDGLVLPPKIASYQIVIIPVVHKDDTKEQILTYCRNLAQSLRSIEYVDQKLSVMVDEREMRGGDKSWNWIKRGIPVRIEVGPRDMEKDSLFVKFRNRPHKEALSIPREEFLGKVCSYLDDMQNTLLSKAEAFRNEHTKEVQSKEEFYKFFTPKNTENPEIHGGFALCYYSQDEAVEAKLKEELGVTPRCIPLDSQSSEGTCIFTGKKTNQKVIFAKAY